MAARKRKKLKEDSLEKILKDVNAHIEEMRGLDHDGFKENVIELFKDIWQGLIAEMDNRAKQEKIMEDAIAKAFHDRDDLLTEVFGDIRQEIADLKGVFFFDWVLNMEHREDSGPLDLERKRAMAGLLGIDFDGMREAYTQKMAQMRP